VLYAPLMSERAPGLASESDHLEATRAYYDEFAARYEARRGGRDPGGYHDLVDDLEVAFVERFGRGRDVLEVGCGTGLLLERFQAFARSARGVDLSPGMLALARGRGLDVLEGSATQLPFPDASFDVACSFKVLAHVREIRAALAEMARVVRPSGHLLAEFYNPWSLRGLAKRFGPARAISDHTDERAVYTRFDAPWEVPALFPPGIRLIASRGVRIVTPFAGALRAPILGSSLRRAEHLLCDSPLRYLGGFWIAALQKD
jgi:ubiquinone/menaquinone biosynthesis C-methylase UbiE